SPPGFPFFFLTSSCLHPHLHSFPTRRSSDLSGLPDGRQHLMDNPALELPCPLLPGAEDQGVQTGLVDHGNLLVTARGVHTEHTPFIVLQVAKCTSLVAQAQHVAHVLGHEPRLSVPLDDAELKPLELELLHASSFIFCLTIRQAHTGHDVLTEHRSQCSPGFASQFSALMPSFTEWKTSTTSCRLTVVRS